MNTIQIGLLIVGILFVTALMWLVILFWIKKRIETIKSKMYEQYFSGNRSFIIEPTSALYRGSDMLFGNVKGNGVIALTENCLIFEKLFGQQIELDRAEIIEAIVEESFKGKTSIATGGKHLVIRTKDGNQIGFLLRDAELWSEKLKTK